jgi:tRNA pseudouridine38-40 synthase
MLIDYEGTHYVGWQLQPNGPSIQAELERALAVVLREPVRIRAAGRTDAGVHACGQVASAPISRVPDDLGRLLRSLNAITPDDIAIRELSVVDDAFDPRRHARSRRYEYRIWRAPAASPFWRRWAWHVPQPLDLGAMQAAAAVLLGEHDMLGFQGPDADPVQSTVRRVSETAFVVDGSAWVYGIEATAFLKNMVRNIVGTLVEIGRGDRPVDSMHDILRSRDRTRAGRTAPPHGLTLVAVRY